MNGKLICGLIGFFIGRLPGALIGLLIGHWIDRNISVSMHGLGPGQLSKTRAAFLRSSFRVMGHVCKADGHVSQAEIAAAEAFMRRLQLSPDLRKQAIDDFNLGKSADFDLAAEIAHFRQHCGRQPQLLRMFIEIQIQAVVADGHFDAREEQVLREIATQMGMREADFERLLQFIRAGGQGSQTQREDPRKALANAYDLLGVDANAGDGEVKKAYRRMISQNHPDKLAAKGLPEEMMTLAKEKTQKIQQAWETIKAARGLN